MAPKVGPRIDTTAPLMFVENVLKTGKMVHDVDRQRTIVRENKELVKKVNRIYRTKGFLDVDYSYRVHQSLNSAARGWKARVIERQNATLLNRLLRRKATVNSNLPRRRKSPWWFPAAERTVDHHRVVIEFWERTDRRLCQLVIDMCPEVSLDEVTLGRGKLFRIYDGTLVVIRSTVVRADDEPLDEYGTLQNVLRGGFVKQMLNGREHFLITLRAIERIPDGKLLGHVAPSSMDKLDLINFYGSKFGRCKEPIYFNGVNSMNGLTKRF